MLQDSTDLPASTKDEIQTWDGARKVQGTRALKYLDRANHIGVCKTSRGSLQGIAAVRIDGKLWAISAMATAEPGYGYGTELMIRIARKAVQADAGLMWTPLPKAEGFYNSIGFGEFEDTGVYAVPLPALRDWLLQQ